MLGVEFPPDQKGVYVLAQNFADTGDKMHDERVGQIDGCGDVDGDDADPVGRQRARNRVLHIVELRKGAFHLFPRGRFHKFGSVDHSGHGDRGHPRQPGDVF
jgi:hypothetical protein